MKAPCHDNYRDQGALRDIKSLLNKTKHRCFGAASTSYKQHIKGRQ